MRIASLLSALAFVLHGATAAHPGGLNAEGCHNNRKTGDYHCHRAPSSAAPSVNQAGNPQLAPYGAQRAIPQALTNATNGLPPGCFVGPRGGTYTITPSGRKNYGGC